MIKPVVNSKTYFILLLISFALSFYGFQIVPKQLDAIVLADERLQITPKEFYIANVIDERDNRNSIATLITVEKGAQPQIYPADLKGGALPAVKQFINNNLARDKNLRPLIIGLKKISIKETVQDNKVEGRVAIVFSFYADKGEEDKIHLGDYSGSAVYSRDARQTQYIEPVLRRVLVNGLVYINTWMDQQAPINISFAKGVKVAFSDYGEKTEGDSIYYSVQRPLTWADFRGKIPTSKYSAEVSPTLGYDEHAEVIKGIVNLRIAVKACLPKSAAWVKDDSRTNYALNHEQRHFDIVKIAAEHFKQKIKALKLPPENYDGPINMEYLDAYREMNNLQKQYDADTNHGLNTGGQERWNTKIDKELKELGVK